MDLAVEATYPDTPPPFDDIVLLSPSLRLLRAVYAPVHGPSCRPAGRPPGEMAALRVVVGKVRNVDEGGPSSAAKRFLGALDRADAEAAVRVVSPDAQGIDEVSRRWIRGPDALIRNVRELVDTFTDMRSEMRDIHVEQWGDSAIVTFWLEQDYTSEGRREHVSAPTTYVFRHEDGDWKLLLGHSIPLPPSP